MEEKKILYNKEDGIGIITLNRPDKMNALQQDMFEDLVGIVNDIILDDEVRAMIITGNGRAFSAGLDLKTDSLANAETDTQERAARIKEVDLPETEQVEVIDGKGRRHQIEPSETKQAPEQHDRRRVADRPQTAG